MRLISSTNITRNRYQCYFWVDGIERSHTVEVDFIGSARIRFEVRNGNGEEVTSDENIRGQVLRFVNML